MAECIGCGVTLPPYQDQEDLAPLCDACRLSEWRAQREERDRIQAEGRERWEHGQETIRRANYAGLPGMPTTAVDSAESASPESGENRIPVRSPSRLGDPTPATTSYEMRPSSLDVVSATEAMRDTVRRLERTLEPNTESTRTVTRNELNGAASTSIVMRLSDSGQEYSLGMIILVNDVEYEVLRTQYHTKGNQSFTSITLISRDGTTAQKTLQRSARNAINLCRSITLIGENTVRKIFWHRKEGKKKTKSRNPKNPT